LLAGEEYADVIPVILQNAPQGGESSVFVARLLNGWPRVAAVAARAVCPWLQARWAFVEAKVSLLAVAAPFQLSLKPCARVRCCLRPLRSLRRFVPYS
jgi:hypothetical protein